ncbi:MAG TPA: hypothetical protein PKD68_02360, partial [Candidatus Saccharibacteria bacterium]|nr:hypothetical protein [Candidatus Saccharibacteria bacterium]
MKITLREISKKIVLVSTAFVLAVSSLLAVLPFLVSETAYAAGETVTISTVAELCDAIDNQADGQTWTIQAGTYDLGVCNSITAGGQTGWYFPITANDLTINGGGATIYGTGYTANGAWHTQDFVAIFGNKVTLSNLTLMSKIYANKVIEVMGDNSTIDNVIVRPNTAVDSSVYDNIADLDLRAWQKEWSGSILYNNTTSAHTLNNVTIYNGGISGSYAPGVTLNMTNVTLDYATNDDWTNSYGVYSSQPWTINGVPHLLYHVNSTLDNIESVMTAVNDSALVGAKTISLDSDIVTNKQITITQPVTFDGNSHTVSPSFPRTDNSNNAAIGIQADNVTLSNLIVDGTSGTNLHGINVFAAANVQFNAVTSKNNDRSGIVNNGSALTVTDVTTAGNGWHGINVDQGSAPSAGVLTVNGVSHHTDTLHIYVDDTAKGSVVDTNNQYAFSHINLNGTHPNDRLYMLKPGVATLLFPANNAVINYNNFDFDWTDVTGAVSYEFRNSLTNAVDGNGMLVTQHFGATSPISQLHSSGAPDGTVRYWQVRAVDANGVKGDWSSVWKMAIDMSTPVVPSATYTATPSGTTKTSGGYTNEKNFKFTLSSSADIVRYQLKYWNDIPGSPFKEASPWNPANLSGYQAGQGLNAYVDQFTQGEGKHYFAFSACDAAGNCSAYSTPFVITYDKTIPDTAITGATVLGNTLSFEGSVSDLHLNYYYCYLTTNQTIVVDGHTFTPGQEVRLNGNADSSRNSACNTTWASGATSFTGVVGGFTIPGVPDGDYTINLVARDLAGNNNAGSPAQYVLTLDRTAPNVTVNPIADSTNTTPTITGTVDADAVSVKVSLDEGVTWNDAVIDGTTWTFAVTSPLAVRTHTV